MVTKHQVDKLLEKDLTPKEVARLIVEDAEDAVRNNDYITDIEEGLTLSEADTQKLWESQTKKGQRKTSQWLQAWKAVTLNEAYAQIKALEAIEFILTLRNRLREMNLMHFMTMEGMSNPVIMTQKEYEQKKQILWELESPEEIPVAEAVRAKADLLYEQETGDYPGKGEEIPEEIYEQAHKWILDLVKQEKLEPKKMDEPKLKDEYDFDTPEDLDIDDWPFRWYFTKGELAKVKGSPTDYLQNFDPDRYEEKVEGETTIHHTPPNVAIIQNPPDFYLDEKGWYNPSDKPGHEVYREAIEGSEENLMGKNYDSYQELYDTLRERGAVERIASFKAHKKIVSHFYKALGVDFQSSGDDVEENENRLKLRIIQYEGQRENLMGFSDKAVWTMSSGEEVEFKPIDYEEIEPSQSTLAQWGSKIEEHLGADWLEKSPEDVVVG